MSKGRCILASAAALVLVVGCGRKSAVPEKAPERVTNVAVEVIAPRQAEDRLEISATVEAWAEVRLSAEVPGRVETIARDEGDTVGAKQVLFEIDASMLKAQAAQAEAALNALKAEQQKMEAGARPEELAIAEARVRGAEATVKQARAGLAQARAAEDNAHRDLQRTQKLFKENVVPPERVDAVETAATIAREKREAAEEGLRAADEQFEALRKELALLKEGARQEDRQAMAARVAQAEAAFNLARIQIEKAQVESPIAGVLNKRYSDVGEFVKAGDPLADIVNAEQVKVVAAVPEKDIPFVRTGDTMPVRFDALNLKRTGTVMFQSRAADPRTLTYEVKMVVDNPEGLIRPGMIARVVLVRRRLPEAISVPIFAVIRRDEGYVAFVENDGKAHLKNDLELGFFDGDRVIVTRGLKAGDRLIVEGHRDLVNGDRVRVRRSVTSGPAEQAGGAHS